MWHVAIQGCFRGDLKRRIAYLKCLTEGAPPYDRHGNVSGAVSEEEAARAAAEWPGHHEELARLRAAEQAKAPEPESPAT